MLTAPNVVLVLLLTVMLAAAAVSAELNVLDYGAKADGTADDSVAIQRALDKAGEAGGAVFLPAGRYRMNSGVNVPPGVTLKGTWEAPHHAEHRKGTILLGYAGKGSEEGPALVYLQPNSAIKGVTIYYPDQRLPEAVPFPWSIQGHGMHCSVMDVTLVNAWKGIDFGEKPHELHYIRNVFGCPLKIGIHIDKCTDIGRIENVHFNPHYWARSGEDNLPDWNELLKFLFENTTAFSIARSDWEYIHNTFSFGCKIGYRFYQSESGACNGNFLGIAADWSQTCILVEQTQGAGLLITNGEFVGGRGSDVVVDIRETHTGVVQFSNTSFWGPHGVVVRANGPGHTSLSQCNFVNWDVDGTGVACIEGLGGTLNVSNSRFGEKKKDLLLGDGLLAGVAMGNIFAGEQSIENNSTGSISISGNVVRP